MKNLWIVLLFTFSSLSLNAQESIGKNVRTISVTGTAERIESANQVDISVRIRTVDETLTGAREKSAKIFGKLLEDLGALEVKPEDVELRNQEFGKEYVDGPGRERVWKGFYSSKSFVIVLGDVEKLELVHAGLAENPDLEVNGTSFSRTDDIEIRKELRIDSLKAAREKAEAMAKVYGQRIGSVLQISEAGSFPVTPFSPNKFETRNTGVNLSVGGSATGKVTLSTSVGVVFELQD